MSRHKLYTAINIIGLAIGICACLAIWTIAHYELSFDSFHPDKERIYRLVSEHRQTSGEMAYWGCVPEPTAPQARMELSGIDVVANFHNYNASVSVPGEQGRVKKYPKIDNQNNNDLIFAEPQYFGIFHYEWVAGNPASALTEPFQVVLSTSEAQKYFGRADWGDILGRTLIYDDSIRVTVTGIVKDWEKTTDFTFKDFISYSTIRATGLKDDLQLDNWDNFNSSSETFVKLAAGVSPERINTQLRPFFDRHKDTSEKGQYFRLSLQPLADLHFSARYDKDYGSQVHLPTLYGLMGIALFILILAAINFINLSTAQSLQRAKEIGIRKVLGSRRTALVVQFMSETFLLVFIALVISLALLRPTLFAFPSFIPAGLRVNLLDPATLGFALVTLILTTFLSGFYPAWVLSSFLPARTLKNQKGSTGGLGNRVSKGLVVFQFTISIVFIIATIVISNQLHFMLGKDLGFARNAIIHFSGEDKDSLTRRSLLRDRIKALPGVERVSLDWQPPAIHGAWSTTIDHAGPASVKADINVRTADTSYIPLYKLRLLAGRNFLACDTVKEVVINATYATMMGFRNPDKAIGQTISLWGKATPIVGVVADFNLRSLQHAIKPLLITTFATTQTGYSVKLRTQGETMVNFRQTIRAIEQNWAAVFPDKPFSYTFVDESLKKLYEGEQKTSQLINLAMAITIIISCMGLFGLAALTAEQRTREIGIRKVLGARVGDITTLLSRDFLLLVLLAFVISSPIAYYFLHRWLQDYTYRTSVSWWIFALAGLSAVSIALLTVLFHAVRAALVNPVKSLRAE